MSEVLPASTASPKKVEVVLQSLPHFKMSCAIRMSERMPSYLQVLDRKNELHTYLIQQEERFMRLALDLKRRNPDMNDMAIEELALQEALPPETDETTLSGISTSNPERAQLERILAKVRTWTD
jgi:hypothetical protein